MAPTPATNTSTYQITLMITAINAPTPATFAVLGFSFLHTKNSTRPTIGTQKPKRPQPMLPLSFVTGVWLWAAFCCTQSAPRRPRLLRLLGRSLLLLLIRAAFGTKSRSRFQFRTAILTKSHLTSSFISCALQPVFHLFPKWMGRLYHTHSPSARFDKAFFQSSLAAASVIPSTHAPWRR